MSPHSALGIPRSPCFARSRPFRCAKGAGRLIVVITLFAPRVAVHVVAVGFPEAWGVGVHESDSADPLGGFPEVEVGDDHANGAAVGGFQRGAVVCVSDHAFAVDHIGGGQVGGVAAVAVSHEKVGRIGYAGVGQEIVDGDAAPVSVELAPFGDAVDVGVNVGLG